MTSKTQCLGHERIESLLAESVLRNRIFPTWIFSGPFGIGKACVAYKFAKYLLSETFSNDTTLDISQEDPIHKLVDSRIHPDLFVLEQGNEPVSINDIRKLFLKIRKKPILSKWRVVILENASDLNRNTYNSLLKILEEPPKDTVIIMICDCIGMIPETLLSRSARINFCPLDLLLVKKILDDMGINNSEKLSQLSEGSVGYALHLNDNNGIEIYDSLLNGFSSNGLFYKKALKYIIENDLCGNFRIIKTSILRILRIYVDILNGVVDKNSKEELRILEQIADRNKNRVDNQVKKVLEIISTINACEAMMLDKNAVIVDAFETFFN